MFRTRTQESPTVGAVIPRGAGSGNQLAESVAARLARFRLNRVEDFTLTVENEVMKTAKDLRAMRETPVRPLGLRRARAKCRKNKGPLRSIYKLSY